MSKKIHYGDQVYIEINGNLSSSTTEARLLCSNGFLGETLFGVKSQDQSKASFRNCIFTITPSLVDSKEDLNILSSLKTELSFLSLHKPDSLAEKFLTNEISSKEKQIELGKDNIEAINKKILDEMDGKKVYFSDVVLLQHLESGYYLCADSSYHPNNPTLNNLRLRKGRTPACYFKFFSYLSASERSSIEYESEMKLISTYLNTAVTMGPMNSSMISDSKNQTEDIDYPNFPADNLRRGNIITSFEGEPLAVGTSLESNDNHRIKLVEYCSKEDLTAYKKKKIIKNGDYVRFQVDDFYLTASKSIYRQNFGLVQQKVEGYNFNLINSIFQIIQVHSEHHYPKGNEIQSLPKNSTGDDETGKFYLKHLVTGEYLSFPENQLSNFLQGGENASKEGTPSFAFINNDLKQKLSLTKNSKVLLKVIGTKEHNGQFYREGEVEEYKIQEVDLNSNYFFGFKNSEDKIKSKLKLLKKSIIGNEGNGSYFRVNYVSEDEMRKVFEFESYANAIKNFMKIYQLAAKNSDKITPEAFENELTKMITFTEKLIVLTTTHDTQAQILIREFKILDQAAKLVYYLVLNDDLKNIIAKKTFRMEQLIQLLDNFCKVLLNVSKDNELSHIYISQYVRIFILCLLESSPLSVNCDHEEFEKLKSMMVEMLSTFLSEIDLESFGQLAHYEALLFKSMDSQRDYSTHVLEVLNHYFRNPGPSSLKENFIKLYVGNPQRIKKIFPKISFIEPREETDDFIIEFPRDNYPNELQFSTAKDEVQKYIIWVFKVIASLAKSRSMKFWNVVINYYPEELCESLLSSTRVSAPLKTNILSMVKSVHFAYNKLPFDRIPPNIQILLPQDSVNQWQKNFEKTIKEAETTLIGQTELGLIKKTSPKFFQSSIMGINKLSSEILNDGYEQIKQGNLDSFPFVLQVMKNLVREDGDAMSQSLWMIHECLGILFEKAADELQNNKRRYYYNACVKYHEKILFIITEIDKNIVKLAFAELIEKLKGKVLQQYASSLNTESSPNGKEHHNGKIEVMLIVNQISGPWKSREKLYEIAGKKSSEAFTESRFMRALWKIIEIEGADLTSGYIPLIKEKANFEAKVTKELCESAFISEPEEISNFDQLISSLLTLNKIARRLQLNDEFDLKAQENNTVLDEIIENLEKVVLSIYNYELHMADENQSLSKEEAQKSFLSRFRYSKIKGHSEVPFRHKSICIKAIYQKIMRFLDGHEIILFFINTLINKQAMFTKCKDEKFKLGYCLAMIILILFMHKNTTNQNIMAENPDFIEIFHINNFRETSTEAIFLYTEMCRENKNILKFEKDYLFDIAVHDFVAFYKSFNCENESPAAINYIRSLPTIISSQIPEDIFDSARFMMKTLFEFFKFIETHSTISLQKLIGKSTHLKAQKTIDESQWKTQNSELKVLDMPIFYIIFKEFLESQKIFALTNSKGSVRIMQSSLTLDKILPAFKNENVEFNFELKQLILQILENINFKNVHKNTNIFLDFEQFNSFISLLFTDIYGYMRTTLDIHDKIFDIFSTVNFSKPENLDYIAQHDKLLETDLNNIAFAQYQAMTIVTQAWKKYVYYVLCDFFDNIISTYKTFMLTTKEKGSVYTSAFENWLALVIKLRELDKDHASRSRLDEALKRAVTHSEYAHKREMVYSLIEDTLQTKTTLMAPSPFTSKTTLLVPPHFASPKSNANGDMEGLIRNILGKKSHYKEICTEENLLSIVLELGQNRPVFKRLIGIVSSHDTDIKSSIFVLKLLRKIVEAENTTKENIFKPIYLWKDVTETEFENIRYSQAVLNDLGVVKSVFNMLYEHAEDKKILKQILLLFIALLYGGNKEVQDQFYIEFVDDIDNEILGSFAQILEETLETLRIKESQKTQESYVSALQFIFNYLYENKELSFDKQTGSVKIPEKLKDDLAASYNQHLEIKKKISIDRDDYDFLLIVLEFLQNLCEGHHLKFQEFLRDQSTGDHSKSFNIPEFLRQTYHVYYKYVNMGNIETGVKILDLLTEIQQGASQENVDILLKKTFINDLCNTMNKFNADLDLLPRGFGFDSNHPDFMTLKSKALVIIKDLVERSDPEKLKKMSQYLDVKALASTFKENVLTFHEKKSNIYPGKTTLVIEDIWEPSLANAFTVYFILKHLSFEETTEELSHHILQAFKDINKEESTSNSEIVNKYLYDFFKIYSGSVEIFDKRLNKLMKIYYPIPAVFSYLKSDTKTEFANRVDRSNTQTKIADLMDSSTELIAQMYIEYKSRDRLFGINFNNAYIWIRFFTNLLAVVVVCMDLFGLQYNDGDISYKGSHVDSVHDGLSALQAVLGGLLAVLWLQTKLTRSLAFKWDSFVTDNVKQMGPLSPEIRQKFIQKETLTKEDGKQILLLKGPYSEEWNYVKHSIFMKQELTRYNLMFTLRSGGFLWHILYSAICIGSIFHPLVTAFQLFDIVVRSDTVTRITLSISRNLTQFLWTLVLMLVTIYVYTLIGFYFIHDRYVTDDGDLCQDTYACYLASLNLGLRTGGGIADSLNPVIYSAEEKGKYFLNTLFDLSFFIIMITLLLNLIFGMIIDAFGDLRDEKTTNEDDMQNVCFICGIPRSEYERTGNFEAHIKEEHNLWKYVAYLIYLFEKEKSLKTDLTDIEDYVLDRYKKKDYVWVPVGRSLTLERLLASEEKEKKSDIDDLKDDIHVSFDRLMELNQRMMVKMEEIVTHSTGTSSTHAPAASQSFNRKNNNYVKKV